MLFSCLKTSLRCGLFPIRTCLAQRKLVLYLCLTTSLITSLFIGLINYGPLRLQTYIVQELKTARATGFQESMSESWQRTGPAITATGAAVSSWGKAAYPFSVHVMTVWYDVLVHIGPPMFLAVSNLNPLVYWVLVGISAIALVLFLLRRECQKRKVFERISMAYERKTNATRREWKKVSDSVRAKSVMAAKLLPHVLFVVLFALMVWLAPASVRAMLADGQTIALLAMPLPLLFSIRAVLKPDHLVVVDGGGGGSAGGSGGGSAGGSGGTFSSFFGTPSFAAAATPSSATPATSTTPDPATGVSTLSPTVATATPTPTTSSSTPVATTTPAATRRPSLVAEQTRKAWLSYWAMMATASLLWQFPILGTNVVQKFQLFRFMMLG